MTVIDVVIFFQISHNISLVWLFDVGDQGAHFLQVKSIV